MVSPHPWGGCRGRSIRPGPTKMQEKSQEKKSITAEDIDKIDPLRAALAWENFKKRLDTKMPEKEARQLLIEELREALSKKGVANTSIPSVLFWKPEESVEDLKRYLDGKLTTSQMKLWELELNELGPKYADAKQDSPGDIKELKKAMEDYANISSDLMKTFADLNMAADARQEELREKYAKTLIALQEYLDLAPESKKREAKYKEAAQELKKIKAQLESILPK